MPRTSRSLWSTIPALVYVAAVVAMPGVFMAGCAEKPIEHTVKKVPAESPAAGQPGALAKTKAEFEQELTASLDKLDAEIRELKAKAETLKDDARTKLDKAVAELDAKQKAARAKLDELGKASSGAWEHLKLGTKAAWEELEAAVKKAAAEF
jgi:hypothetical protein